MAQTDIEDCAWEYNAPQFIDFSSNHALYDDDADKWFDTVTEDGYIHQNTDICADVDIIEDADAGIENEPETPKSESRRLTRSMANTPINEKGLPEATEGPKSPIAAPQTQKGPKVLSNLCTNLSEWRKQKVSKTNSKPQPVVAKHMISAEPRRHSPRIAQPTTKENCSKEDSAKRTKSVRAKSTSDSVSLQEVRKTRRSEESTSSRGRSNSLKRSTSLNRNRTNSVDRATKRGHSRGSSASQVISSDSSKLDNSVPTVSKMPKLTCPSTPTFMKRKPMIKNNNEKMKNSEQIEMEKIAYLRNEMVKKRKIAQESMKKSLGPTVVTAVRAVKEPTMPQEFQFHTDDRIKSQGVETRSGSKQKDFTQSLRSANSPSVQSQVIRGPTIPQPFSLTECRKRKLGSMEDLASSYHSMAEKVNAFHKQTPDRFRSRPRKSSQGYDNRRGRSQSPKGVTVPKTPNFETRSRSRPLNLPTREEIEAQEVEEMKKCQFKAHPVNQKILQNPNTGVKKVPSKPLTETEEFHLSSDKRVNNESNTSSEAEKFEFHAKPVPKRILKGTVGVKPLKVLPITIAKSPAFALKHRARVPIDLPEDISQEDNKIKAHPAPHVGLPFQPKLGHKSTVIEPFTFESRDRITRARKEEKMKEMLEEEKQAREFCATRYPSPTADPLPPKHTKPATVPQPFNLQVETRGARKAEEWRHKLEEELHHQKQQASFKAKPSDILHKEPFIPQKSDRPLTDISDFELNTEKRAMTREQYEMFKKAKEAENEALKRQKMKRQEEEDKKAVAKLRAELVHKSAPVKKYAPVKVQPSSKPLTVANTPKFNTDSRLRSRHSDR